MGENGVHQNDAQDVKSTHKHPSLSLCNFTFTKTHSLFFHGTYFVVILSNGDWVWVDVEEHSLSAVVWEIACSFVWNHGLVVVNFNDVDARWVNVGGRLVDEVVDGLGVDDAFHFMWFCFLVIDFSRIKELKVNCVLFWDYYSE